jgi:hypothetical protein
LDLPVDFDALAKVGSIMGSGGMIVMDQDTCMVDVARYFVDFLKDESCGQCNPCREGLKQMLAILTDICQGNGKQGDVELLEEIGTMMQKFSLCGLGTSAPNPVLTNILYFRDEYEAHIRDKKCPAGVCKPLFIMKSTRKPARVARSVFANARRKPSAAKRKSRTNCTRINVSSAAFAMMRANSMRLLSNSCIFSRD